MKNKSRGFTLLELLVVIAIVGLLTYVIVVSINSARIKSRNAKRVTDIHQIFNAFNLNADNLNVLNSIPSNQWVCIGSTCYEGWSSFTTPAALDAFLNPVLSSKPNDPKGGNRGYGGYLFVRDFPGDVSSYDGAIIPPGNVVQYLLEFPATTCPIGKIRKILDLPPNRQHVQCYVHLPDK